MCCKLVKVDSLTLTLIEYTLSDSPVKLVKVPTPVTETSEASICTSILGVNAAMGS